MTTKEIVTVFHLVEDYIANKYVLRYNTISCITEIRGRNENTWSELNDSSLWLELRKKDLTISQTGLNAILKSHFVPNYNPLRDYFDSLSRWDGQTDYISEFSRYVELADPEERADFEYTFKKWCVRVVKCALIPGYFNKQAFILSDDGNSQNAGKTSYCRYLCPPALTDYITQNLPENEKDARICMAKNILINLDELDSLSSKDVNKLKALFTIDKLNERLPYDRTNSNLMRIASFIGSTNRSTFLYDETGSVRWLCYVIKSINWNYREFDINKLWQQAYQLAIDPSFDSEISKEDILKNERRNDKFHISTPESELIVKFFRKPEIDDIGEFMTATDMLHHMSLYTAGVKLNVYSIGKSMKRLGFERVKKGIYGYYVEKLIQ